MFPPDVEDSPTDGVGFSVEIFPPPFSQTEKFLPDAEIQAGEDYFQGILDTLAAEGVDADLRVAHGRNPKDEIVRVARELRPDLIVMGAHGHRGVKDLIFGNTINGVRHEAGAPVLVVGE